MSPSALLLTTGLGLLAGCQHAVTGPDHLAGVAPFAAAAGRRAWRVGFGWGLGHALGALAAAGVALVLRGMVPGIEVELSAWSERIVGVLLCFVGVLGLAAALRARARAHAREQHEIRAAYAGSVRDHELEALHDHTHPRANPRAHEALHVHLFGARHHDPARGHSALLLGVFHGAAGLSHLFATLPALALPGFVLPALYLLGYALGSLACLTLVASGIGRLAERGGAVHARVWLAGTSAASLALGLVWIVAPH